MPDYMLTDHAAAACGCEIRRDEPMKLHTTFRIGGPADRFYIVKTVKQLSCMLGALHDSNTPYFVLGNGSNLLVSDQGIRRAVLSLSGDFRKVELIGGAAVRAGAAATLASVCAFARENCLTGLEFAWGIPGSVGGAAYMNAGAYGGEMKDVVRRVHSVSARGSIEIFLPEKPLYGDWGHHHVGRVCLETGEQYRNFRKDGRIDAAQKGKAAL